MKQQDENRLTALRYIVDSQHGYVGDLIAHIGDAFVKEFLSLGFVCTGYAKSDKTWHVSDLVKQYYSVVC